MDTNWRSKGYSKIELADVTVIALKLANKVYSHAVTIINIIINAFPTNIDLFVYNIVTGLA